jgi:esterase/lipase superfamily enzyme
MNSHVVRAAFLLLLLSAMLVACGGNKPKSNQIFLMPAPDVYEEGKIDPFIELGPIAEGSHPGILFATDRKPAAPDDKKYDYYTHERGGAVRLGIAQVQLGEGEAITWSEARQISLLKSRTDNYPLEVVGVENYGPLARTVSAMDETTEISDEPGQRFADEINRRLARSRSKDVYIYVHGYKVNFENPVLVASEFWHFLGYNGAFIAYSWPTKFSMFAYLADLDSAVNSGRRLRALVLHIAENTDVDKIHIAVG